MRKIIVLLLPLLLLLLCGARNTRVRTTDRANRVMSGGLERTVVFHCDDGSTDHTGWVTDADVYHEDTDGSIMCYDYGYLGTADAAWTDSTNVEQYARKIIYDSFNDTWPAHGTTWSSAGMVWFNLDLLLRNVEILSAELCITTATNQNPQTYNDGGSTFQNGLHAVLDTLLSDVAWVSGGTDCDGCGDPRYRDVSWKYMDTSKSTLWDPLLLDRTYSWEWGIRSKPIWTVGDETQYLVFDVTEAVQQYVCDDNMANAGWWFFPEYGDGNFLPTWGPHADTDDKQPFLKVTYKTGFYKQRWNGYPLVFCFTTDDVYEDNEDWHTITQAAGASMTAFVIEDKIGTANRLTSAELVTLTGSGFMVGSHSRTHDGTAYIFHDLDPPDPADPGDTEIDRNWLETLTGNGPHKVLAFPEHRRNRWSDEYLSLRGYLGARGGGANTAGHVYSAGAYSSSPGEPAQHLRWYTPKGTSLPVNLFAVAITANIADIVGHNDADECAAEECDPDCWNPDKAEIRASLKPYIAAAADSGYAAIVLYAHRDKASSVGYGGIDDDELEWIYEIFDEHGGVLRTDFESMVSIYRAYHAPTELPETVNGGAAGESFFLDSYTYGGSGFDGIVATDSIYWDATADTPGVR